MLTARTLSAKSALSPLNAKKETVFAGAEPVETIEKII